MELLRLLAGDVRDALPSPFGETVLIVVSIICGALVGTERERAEKPAGLRTLTLICLGSTIFTLMSLDRAFDAPDRSRIAAQIVTGVGFLGAGVILRERGSVTGLTTAASVWVVAAVGMVVGAGYALSGLALSGVVLFALTFLSRLEERFLSTCDMATLHVIFQPQGGKTRARITSLLDGLRMPFEIREEKRAGDRHEISLRYCQVHKSHRAFTGDLAAIDGVERLESEGSEERPR